MAHPSCTDRAQQRSKQKNPNYHVTEIVRVFCPIKQRYLLSGGFVSQPWWNPEYTKLLDLI